MKSVKRKKFGSLWEGKKLTKNEIYILIKNSFDCIEWIYWSYCLRIFTSIMMMFQFEGWKSIMKKMKEGKNKMKQKYDFNFERIINAKLFLENW